MKTQTKQGKRIQVATAPSRRSKPRGYTLLQGKYSDKSRAQQIRAVKDEHHAGRKRSRRDG